MAYATNETDICNLALDHLNQLPITSITTPTSKTEGLCARWYHTVRRSILRHHTWNFAMKRTSLAASATAPAFQYDSQYPLPADYIRLVQIGEWNEYKDYGVESNMLLVNSSSAALNFRYVFDNEVVTTFDPLFVELFSLRLALKLAYPITGSQTNEKRINELLALIQPSALTVDGQERPPRRVERSKFKDARRKNGNYGSKWLED